MLHSTRQNVGPKRVLNKLATMRRQNEHKNRSLQKKLSKALTDIGNPFQEKCWDLLSLDTNDIAHHTATKWISRLLKKGKV